MDHGSHQNTSGNSAAAPPPKDAVIFTNSDESDRNFCNYEIVWTSSMNPGSQTVAGTSQPAVTEQKLGQPQHTAASVDSHPRRKNHGAIDWLVRKREKDRAYRARVKEKDMIMRKNLCTLGEENKRLKHENESLTRDKLLLDQRWQSQSKEVSELRSAIDTLNHECKKLKELVQTLSDCLLCLSDLQNKNVELKIENMRLKQNSSSNPKSIKLVEENGRLRLDNKILREQNDALCGKLVREGNVKKQSCMNN